MFLGLLWIVHCW